MMRRGKETAATRPSGGRDWSKNAPVHRWAALALVLALISPFVRGEAPEEAKPAESQFAELAAEPAVSAPEASPVIADAVAELTANRAVAVPEAAPAILEPAPCETPASDGDNGKCCRRPPTEYWGQGVWFVTTAEFFVKYGWLRPMGRGFFEDRTQTGFQIQAGARQDICWCRKSLVLYGELGGIYAQNDGIPPPVLEEEEFEDPDPNEFRWGRAFTAFGISYFPPVYHNWDKRMLHVDIRGGGRVGHVHVRYDETVFPIPEGTKETSITTGLFGSIGIGLTLHDVCLWEWHCGQLTFGAEVEIAHDWMDLGAFGNEDGGLATVSPMLSVSFRY